METNAQLFFPLPQELQFAVFDLLNEVDLQSTRHVCCNTEIENYFAARIAASIQMTIEMAKICDVALRELTGGKRSLLQQEKHGPSSGYSFFQFDPSKWETRFPEPIFKNFLAFKRLRDECHLDLVEALSEYNIASGLIEGEQVDGQSSRFITKLRDSLPEMDTGLAAIFDQAQQTLKGDMFIVSAYDYSKEPLLVGRDFMKLSELSSSVGLFAEVWFVSPENDNWISHNYRRFSEQVVGYSRISFEDLIGKRENDRCFIKPNILLRCRQQPYRYGEMGLFHDRLVQAAQIAIARTDVRDPHYAKTMEQARRILDAVDADEADGAVAEAKR